MSYLRFRRSTVPSRFAKRHSIGSQPETRKTLKSIQLVGQFIVEEYPFIHTYNILKRLRWSIQYIS